MSIGLNFEKANASLLLISKLIGDEWCNKYNVMKILYFAEKLHLAKYGRTITGDSYIAMTYGPVPSSSYDTLKSDSEIFELNSNPHYLKALREPDMDEFSESDIECIELAVADNIGLDFRRLKDKSHDSAYNEASFNGVISTESIAKAAGASDDMLKYINLVFENSKCSFDAPI